MKEREKQNEIDELTEKWMKMVFLFACAKKLLLRFEAEKNKDLIEFKRRRAAKRIIKKLRTYAFNQKRKRTLLGLE